MKRIWLALFALLFWNGAAMAKPIKVMILDGASAAPYHDWKLSTRILKRELEETGLFDVTVVTAPPADGDFSGFHPEFARYQVVVSNYDSQDWPAAIKAEFEAYMKNGGGLVTVHGADNAFPDWPAFNEMTGIGGWRKRDAPAGPKWFYNNGKLESDTAPRPRRPAWQAQTLPHHGAGARPPDHARVAAGMDARYRRALHPPARSRKEHDGAGHGLGRSRQSRHRFRRTHAAGADIRQGTHLPHYPGP